MGTSEVGQMWAIAMRLDFDELDQMAWSQR
jgi:hypothetical protein